MLTLKQKIMLGICGFALLAILLVSFNMFDTVEKGTYQIKQAAISGTMSAKMTPGIHWQLFGDIQTWPKAETFFFTHDKEGGDSADQSIEVRFVDGSLARISGTMRIQMPVTETDAINLVVVEGYKNFKDVEQKLVLPVVRNALRLTANLMTARESYAEKRADFTFWAWDQIQNGLYETTEEGRMVKDPITAEESWKTFKIIKEDGDGRPLRQKNPLDSMGLVLANFEVKSFEYDDKVKEQISTQQKALMRVATAAAEAKAAEQNKITAEAVGKEAVTKAQYAQEEIKIKAVVQAEQEKEVAELGAQKEKEVARLGAERELEVADLQKQAAELQKAREILLGEGESERKRMVLEADGALEQKIAAIVQISRVYAENFGKQRWVPEIQMGGSSEPGQAGSNVTNMIDLLTAQSARQLGLDLGIKGPNTQGN